ncbi:hypothetical protein TB2_039620 [Malus domestica]
MSELLMGSGFDDLLEQLSQIQIVDTHVGSDSHCAACKKHSNPRESLTTTPVNVMTVYTRRSLPITRWRAWRGG